MTFLAYDPERLASLRLQMAAAVDERRRVASTDPAAADALRVVRLALDVLDHVWMPFVTTLLATDPLARGVPHELGDLTLLRLDVTGVHALAQTVAEADPSQLADDERMMSRLAAEMELIGAHPELVRALLADLDEMEPYVAAILVSHLGLRGAELAEVADSIVMRWWQETWAFEQTPGVPAEYAADTRPNAADVLFPLIAADPAACRRYVELAGAHPYTLFQSSTQPDLAHRIAYVATDPGHTDAATAGRLLLPLLDWFGSEWAPRYGWALDDLDLPLCFVDLLAPWLVQLSPLNHDWGLTAEQQRHLIEVLIADDRALERLLANAEQLQAAVLRATAADDIQLVAQLAAYAGLVAELLVRRRYEDEQLQAACWSVILGLTATIVSLPLSIAGNVTVAGVSTVASGFLPFDPDRAACDEFYVQSYTRTLTIALIAHQLYATWCTEIDGLATPPPPMPDPDSDHPFRDYCDALLSWHAGLPGGDTGELAEEFDAAILPWILGFDAGSEIGRS